MFENTIYHQVRLPRQQPRWGGKGWKTESDRGEIYTFFLKNQTSQRWDLSNLYSFLFLKRKKNLTEVGSFQSFLIPIFEKPNLKKVRSLL